MTPASLARLILLGMIWGASFLFQRVTVPAVGASFTAAARLALSAALLLVMLHLLRRPLDLRRRWRGYLLLGAFSAGLPFLFFALAARQLPAGYLAVVNATVPLFTVVLLWAVLRQRPSISKLAGVVVGLLGVAVLARYGSVAFGLPSLLAFTLALAASLMYAGSALVIRRHYADTDPLVLAGCSQLGAAVVLAPLGLVHLPAALPTPGVVLSLVALGLVCTGLAYVLYFRLLHDIGTEKAVTNTFLVPIFAQIWGAAFLGEHPTWISLTGSVLVLLAVALVFEKVPWIRRR